MTERRLQWRKSSFSIVGECVELSGSEGVVAMRDSKLGDRSPILEFSPGDLAELLDAVKAGTFDHFQ